MSDFRIFDPVARCLFPRQVAPLLIPAMPDTLTPTLRSVRPRVSARPKDESGMVATALPNLLVIDDDHMVRRALVRVLRRKFNVTELEDAESALDLLDAGRAFDAIVCDLNLNGLSGRGFLVTLDAMRDPHWARTVILSGTTRDGLNDAYLEALGDRFVEKPATAAQIELVLADIVRQRAHAA